MPRKKSEPKETPKPAPGPRNQAALDRAAAEHSARPVRVSVKFEHQGDGSLILGATHRETEAHQTRLENALGTTSPSFMATCLAQLDIIVRGHGEEPGGNERAFNAALAMIEAIGPQDELEAALAVQMVGCHVAALDMLGRATQTASTDRLALFGNMATKMQRTFTAQIEALGRMRGKGQQTVRVEHVNVHPGGQAIVGDVHHHPRGKQGGNPKNEEPPHETWSAATGAQEREALPCEDATGNGVPVAGNAERPLQDSRRPIDRRRNRKSERP